MRWIDWPDDAFRMEITGTLPGGGLNSSLSAGGGTGNSNKTLLPFMVSLPGLAHISFGWFWFGFCAVMCCAVLLVRPMRSLFLFVMSLVGISIIILRHIQNMEAKSSSQMRYF